MKKILLIEDDLEIYALLQYNLHRAGFYVVGTNSGKEAVNFCLQERPDLILLDILLPDGNGLEIFSRLRKHIVLAATPVIFITALASEADRVTGLELGANDYIVKPFSIREVIARIKIHLSASSEEPGPVLRGGTIELDRSRCQVRNNGKLVALTATEFRLLDFLMSRPRIVFSREQLLSGVWGVDTSIVDRGVDVYILRLRKKLEVGLSSRRMIWSVRGFGYMFNPDGPEGESEAAAAQP